RRRLEEQRYWPALQIAKVGNQQKEQEEPKEEDLVGSANLDHRTLRSAVARKRQGPRFGPRFEDFLDCDLLRPLRPPVAAQTALDDLVEVDDVVPVLVEQLADTPAINGGVVGADDHRVAALDIVETAAGRTVAHQELAAIGDDQSRL